MQMTAGIRPFRPGVAGETAGDVAALSDIFARTAANGQDARAVLSDDRQWGDVFAVPYAVRHPDLAFVVVTDDARAGARRGSARRAEPDDLRPRARPALAAGAAGRARDGRAHRGARGIRTCVDRVAGRHRRLHGHLRRMAAPARAGPIRAPGGARPGDVRGGGDPRRCGRNLRGAHRRPGGHDPLRGGRRVDLARPARAGVLRARVRTVGAGDERARGRAARCRPVAVPRARRGVVGVRVSSRRRAARAAALPARAGAAPA